MCPEQGTGRGEGGLGVYRHLTQVTLSTQGLRSVASRVQGFFSLPLSKDEPALQGSSGNNQGSGFFPSVEFQGLGFRVQGSSLGV